MEILMNIKCVGTPLNLTNPDLLFDSPVYYLSSYIDFNLFNLYYISYKSNE